MQAGSLRWSMGQKVLAMTLALLAFAGNSLLCRLALRGGAIDPASFTTLRLVSGALVLGFLMRWYKPTPVSADPSVASTSGDWYSALALFVYAAGFSWAYTRLSTATGALLLFGAVQISMVVWAFWKGERFQSLQCVGLVMACSGLVMMFLPGLETPPWMMALLMLLAGVGWGIYSLRGGECSAEHVLTITAGNFGRATVLAVVVSLVSLPMMRLSSLGILYAVLAGALASGLGYALWYSVVAQVRTTTAAGVQLVVPVLTAVGAVLWLGEPLTGSLMLCALAELGGVALMVGVRAMSPAELASPHSD